MKKILSIVIVILLTYVSLVSNLIAEEPTSKQIIYVDDDGDADYTKIQDAIDNANDGDTVFVYSGTYFENVVVNKSIHLVGEDRNTTIIDGWGLGIWIGRLWGFRTTSDNVLISGFTIKNCTRDFHDTFKAIYLSSNNNIITNNIIKESEVGIKLYSSCNNTISNNLISNCFYGMDISRSNNSTIINNNIISNLWVGLDMWSSCDNTIYHNNFMKNQYHIIVWNMGEYNIWDNGYPSGGNYWDNYTGSDSDGDGIGDTPYDDILMGGKDQYPLMTPYPVEKNQPILNIVSPIKGLYINNSRILDLSKFILIIGSFNFQTIVFDNESLVNLVEYYLNDELVASYDFIKDVYNWTWDEYGFGKYTVKVVAYDNCGNYNEKILTVWKFF